MATATKRKKKLTFKVGNEKGPEITVKGEFTLTGLTDNMDDFLNSQFSQWALEDYGLTGVLTAEEIDLDA